MLKFQADYVFPVSRPPVQNGIVVVNPDGTIAEIVPPNTFASHEVTRLEGILCPGFVNSHCHIELSHLKGAIPQGGGLTEFLKPIGQLRNQYSLPVITHAITAAEQEMLQNGIVAVGDISNTQHSFTQKARGNLYYHTLAEVFSLNPARAQTVMEQGIELFEQAPASPKHLCSIAPHAPYTVSENLLRQIDAFNARHSGIISIHNQETADEDVFFRYGTGGFAILYHAIGATDVLNYFTPPGTSSLQYILQHLSGKCSLLLVHNTFTSAADIDLALRQYSNTIYWCFCPNANLYIEGCLPHFDNFIARNARIVVGTDSLASNHRLCILSELKTISSHAPHIPLSMLLTWATLNGAEALGFSRRLGSLEPGKQPGLVLIENVNTQTLQLTPQSTAQRVM
ncbi:hypothetical protein C7N43_03970 [Sphingobacteriales bacterium UPWRP_1]|nr:hypothetical protein B6N25_05610 [Sphingobacteriales bacterium TSM_CSS]PSJ78366.1 hypothetical protein C7N43_03970 [Sphingobacteriales bacterium UPWRP_1]